MEIWCLRLMDLGLLQSGIRAVVTALGTDGPEVDENKCFILTIVGTMVVL